jgi:hypothetical protein
MVPKQNRQAMLDCSGLSLPLEVIAVKHACGRRYGHQITNAGQWQITAYLAGIYSSAA